MADTNQQPIGDDKIKQAVDAVKELVSLFKMERMVYLVITMISVSFLVGTAISLILASKTQENTIALIGLFGSSGTIVYSTGRLLRMWSEAMKLIHAAANGNSKD